MTSNATQPIISGRLGTAIAVAVLLFPIFSGLAQLYVDSHRDSLNLKLEQKKLSLNQDLEKTKNLLAARTQDETNRLEVNKLFLDHYQSASANVQRQTIDILVTLYPTQFVSVAKIFNNAALTPQIRQDVQKAASAAVTTSRISTASPAVVNTKTSDVSTIESAAFSALSNGDLVSARTLFSRAYSIFPTYHNVDEISHLVLTDNEMEAYSNAAAASRSVMLKKILRVVLADYSWGIPPTLLAKIHAKAG